jgi:hypothetical protein
LSLFSILDSGVILLPIFARRKEYAMVSKQPKKPSGKKPAPLSSKTASPPPPPPPPDYPSSGKHIKKIVIEL